MSTKPKLDSLTGLRGIAALCVVFDHYAVWCAPYDRSQEPWIFDRVFDLGGIGMSVFFTLSGFVIAYNYLDLDWNEHPLRSAGSFGWLRFSRLYPALLLFIVITASRPGTFAQLGQWYAAVTSLAIFSLQSFYPIRVAGDLITQTGYNISWSISTEIGLYGLFVIAIIAIRFAQARLGQVAIYAAMAIGALYLASMVWLMWHPGKILGLVSRLPTVAEPLSPDNEIRWFFYNAPFCRFYDFLFGWLAVIVMRARIELLGLVAGLAAIAYLGFVIWFLFWSRDEIFMQSLSAPLLAVIMAGSGQSNWINRTLSVGWLVFVGEISFSLYLFHPLAAHLIDLGHGQPPTTFWIAIFFIIFALGLTLALSLATGIYYLVEMPGQRFLRGTTL